MSTNKALRAEYLSRINRVIDYIETHLAEPLKLSVLARVANFSPYHFHRIFSSLMNETLNHFILRLRLEKAATFLLQYPQQTITEIALDCGFSGSATFARAFKEYYKMSASEWRRKIITQSNTRQIKSNISQTLSNAGKAFGVSPMYIDTVNHQLTWRITMKKTEQSVNVRIEDRQPMHVAYVRHIGPYEGDADLFSRLFQKLMRWAGPRGLLQQPGVQMLAVYHDNPDITDENHLRTSVCVTIPEGTPVDGEIGKMDIPGGKYAIGHFELKSDEYGQAWQALCAGWLPESGFEPDGRPSMELYLNDYREHPEGKHIVDICIPVKPV